MKQLPEQAFRQGVGDNGRLRLSGQHNDGGAALRGNYGIRVFDKNEFQNKIVMILVKKLTIFKVLK